MAAKSKEEKAAEALAAETARREALSDEERQAEDAKKAEDEASAKAEADAKEAAEAEKAAAKGIKSVTVTYDGGQVREYSKAVHGDNFMTHAKEFAKKRDGTIV